MQKNPPVDPWKIAKGPEGLVQGDIAGRYSPVIEAG